MPARNFEAVREKGPTPQGKRAFTTQGAIADEFKPRPTGASKVTTVHSKPVRLYEHIVADWSQPVWISKPTNPRPKS